MLPRIIGITGYKRSGKDTIARHLSKKYGYVHLSFSDPLKHAVKHLFDFSENELWGDEKEKMNEFWGISPREALNYVGTSVVRNQFNKLLPGIEGDFFIRLLKKKMEDMMKKDSEMCFVVSDCRFLNEVNFLRSFDDTLIFRVCRDDAKLDPSLISEKEIDLIEEDMLFENNGNVQELYESIDEYLL